MCIILDASIYSPFCHGNEDMRPVIDWVVRGKGRIAYSPTQKMREEIDNYPMFRKYIDGILPYRQANLLKRANKDKVERQQRELEKQGNLKSNDPHVIALALVARAKVLVSGDKDLHADFKNKDIVGGKVYQHKDHKHLLRENPCR